MPFLSAGSSQLTLTDVSSTSGKLRLLTGPGAVLMREHTHTHEHTRRYADAGVGTHTDTGIHTHMVCTQTDKNTHIDTGMHAHRNTYTHRYGRTQEHIHTQVCMPTNPQTHT